MMKIFKIINVLFSLAILFVLVRVALIFAADELKPVIIIVAIILFFVKARIGLEHFVLISHFLSKGFNYLYIKIRGENKTDLIVNLSLVLAALLVIVSLIMFLQKSVKTVVSVSDTTIQEILGVMPATYKNGAINTSAEPVQIPFRTENPIMHKTKGGEYYIFPLAIYEIAGIVAVKNMESMLMLGGADLGPVDIGLVWGKLAEPENYKNIKFASAFRLMMPSVKREINLERDYVQTHFSHNHIIPSNSEILDAVRNLKVNEKVILRGYLVEVKIKTSKLQTVWKSSLRRDDHLFNSGAGCEVFYVTDVLKEI
ncbi:MAG: hypothetical protein A2Y25_05025 [Candidatus Melainabacteria bacterium GWF2_37_15]|nr:MAG: hypothetical protein A2Y25_05025 [Candidatus Melainabacteria bacterium GWF2_37_15]